MEEDQIKQFRRAISKWCWDNDFAQFCRVTGFTGDYAADKWRALRNLNTACDAFDAATLARILNS